MFCSKTCFLNGLPWTFLKYINLINNQVITDTKIPLQKMHLLKLKPQQHFVNVERWMCVCISGFYVLCVSNVKFQFHFSIFSLRWVFSENVHVGLTWSWTKWLKNISGILPNVLCVCSLGAKQWHFIANFTVVSLRKDNKICK